jgi:hypothetical protein
MPSTQHRHHSGLRLEGKLRSYSRKVQSQQSSHVPSDYISPAVAPVIDQGCCGSCYAVAIAGALQDRHNAAHGANVTLKVGDVLSFADFPLLWDGCRGGYIGGDRLEAFMHTHGIAVAESGDAQAYPACAQQCTQHGDCLRAERPRYEDRPRVRATSWIEVNQPVSIRRLLSGNLTGHTEGSVAVGFGCLPSFVQGSGRAWPRLQEPLELEHGIVLTQAHVPLASETRAFANNPNSFHAACVVGYVTLPASAFVLPGLGGVYWVLRNSWGTTWADGGYALVSAFDNHVPAPFERHGYAFDSGGTQGYKLPLAAGSSSTAVVPAAEAEHDTQVLLQAIDETVHERLKQTKLERRRERAWTLRWAVAAALALVVVLLLRRAVRYSSASAAPPPPEAPPQPWPTHYEIPPPLVL